MAKRKGLTILLDEDISASLLIDFLLSKGYKVEVAVKGEKDHYELRSRLARSPKPLFLTKDKGWLKAGAVPKRHGGVYVFEAGHLDEVALTGLVHALLQELESYKRLSNAILDRRFLRTRDTIWEYSPDGSRAKVWPLG